ncbi:MAG: glutathione S-transferase N-terminal domain-containing protein [Ardenticatenaceae bacterium]|nr:glutathione S-transferase N-terminal domain-containing protein [Ardenticatenaceae bacterium]
MKNSINPTEKVMMYGTPTCPMVPPVRGILNRAQVPFDYVNIAEDAESRGKVMAINDGNASVPTLVFPDGSTLTEPSTAVLREKLHSLGYKVPPPNLWQSLRDNPFYSIMGTAMFLFGVYDGNWVFMALGLAMLAYAVVISRR